MNPSSVTTATHTHTEWIRSGRLQLMQKCGRRSQRLEAAWMAALVLSSETRDTLDGVTIKLRVNVIKVGGLRRKFYRNSEQTNFDFELITEESTGKKNLKMEAWFGTGKISATIHAVPSRSE